MKDQNIPRQSAMVFFARDFLSIEFPKLADMFPDYIHIYITVNQQEAERVRQSDPTGEIFVLDEIGRWSELQSECDDFAFNRDRFLRTYSKREILEVTRVLQGISQECLRRFKINIYIDEPVSGYPNQYFNRVFSAGGAKCLHFQTTWIPGYMFFTADPAQAAPVELGWSEDWASIVDTHIDNRLKGLAKPVYVIDYSRRRKRLQDALLTAGKYLYRLLARRHAFYIDRDPSAHLLHVQCLVRSFISKTYKVKLDDMNGEKFVLFPLHYEPESVLSYFSPFQRQEEVAAQIMDSLPIDYRLIIKEHPSQPGALNMAKWKPLVRSERVIALSGDFDVRELFKLDVVIVSIASTLALEAAVMGRPAGVLGSAHFAKMPGIKQLDTPTDWLKLLDQKPAQLVDIKKWYVEFMRRYSFPGSIMRDNTNTEMLAESLGHILRSLA